VAWSDFCALEFQVLPHLYQGTKVQIHSEFSCSLLIHYSKPMFFYVNMDVRRCTTLFPSVKRSFPFPRDRTYSEVCKIYFLKTLFVNKLCKIVRIVYSLNQGCANIFVLRPI